MGIKKVKSKKREYSHFCFCLRLRPGVIISSALWIIEGIVLSIIFGIFPAKAYKEDKDDKEKETKPIYFFVKYIPTILLLYFIILSIISTLGLISLIVNKSTSFLRMYSYTSWFYAVFINSVIAIVSIITIFASKNEYKTYLVEVEDLKPINDLNSVLLWLSIVAFFQISLHIYFSIILRAYVKRYMQKEKGEKVERKFSIVSSKRSSSSSPNIPSLFNIKVDKTFDVRNQIV